MFVKTGHGVLLWNSCLSPKKSVNLNIIIVYKIILHFKHYSNFSHFSEGLGFVFLFIFSFSRYRPDNRSSFWVWPIMTNWPISCDCTIQISLNLVQMNTRTFWWIIIVQMLSNNLECDIHSDPHNIHLTDSFTIAYFGYVFQMCLDLNHCCLQLYTIFIIVKDDTQFHTAVYIALLCLYFLVRQSIKLLHIWTKDPQSNFFKSASTFCFTFITTWETQTFWLYAFFSLLHSFIAPPTY